MNNNRILAIIVILPMIIGTPALCSAQQKLHWTPTNGPYQPLGGDVNFFEADGHIFGGGDQSTDDGLTWGPFYDKALNWQINGQSLQVDSQGHLFGQFGTFYHFSSDTGVTWSPGFPSPPVGNANNSPIIDGRGRLLIEGYDDTLYWTSNFGVTWNGVSPFQYPPGILTVGSGDNLFAWPYDSLTQPYEAYFFHSDNLMRTWRRVTIDSGRRLILSPVYWFNDSSIWAVTDSGLFTSHDTGHSFQPTGAGLKGNWIYLFQWYNDSYIWIATDSGLFTSQDRAR